ncbi:hypothetical protein WN944_001670 [Citrus x changshan-huyou]|uniref:Uncharacterized protein n=1 Tax=Citrus x changshan-huyou TaxID=2935761 RepID=A0AAP0QRL7_9ROSI
MNRPTCYHTWKVSNFSTLLDEKSCGCYKWYVGICQF